MTGLSACVPLFPTLLGVEFPLLDPCIRRIHEGSSGKWRGRVQVARGRTMIARLLGLVASLPSETTETPIEVNIETSARGERWVRIFADGSRMTSTLDTRGGLLAEHLGLVSVYFKVLRRDAGVEWLLERIVMAGIPLPVRWFEINARIDVRDGRYHFLVDSAVRGGGRLMRYEGFLDAAG